MKSEAADSIPPTLISITPLLSPKNEVCDDSTTQESETQESETQRILHLARMQSIRVLAHMEKVKAVISAETASMGLEMQSVLEELEKRDGVSPEAAGIEATREERGSDEMLRILCPWFFYVRSMWELNGGVLR